MIRHRIGLVAAIWLVGCNGCTVPPTPQPVPPPQPDPTAADASPPPLDQCGAQCDHLRAMGCQEWAASCSADCERLDQKLGELPGGHPPADHVCIIGAQSCEAARKCGAP